MKKLIPFLLAFFVAGVQAQSCCDRDAFRNNAGRSLWYFPNWITPSASIPQTASASTVIDAANDEVAHMGYVHIDGTGTKACTAAGGCSVQWLTGAVTWATANSAIVVSLQNLSTSTVPLQTDGTADVSNTLVQGTDSLAATTWITTDFDADDGDGISLANGDLIGINWKMTVRNGADSVVINTPAAAASTHIPGVSVNTGAWATVSGAMPNAIITFDDGTLGWIDGSIVYSVAAAASYTTATTPDEPAICFYNPIRARIDALWGVIRQTAGADAEYVLYSNPLGSPSAMVTVTLDEDNSIDNSSIRQKVSKLASEYTLERGWYAVSLRATTANTVQTFEYTVASNSHLKAWGGVNAYFCGRSDQTGAFSVTTTKLPILGVRYSRLWYAE